MCKIGLYDCFLLVGFTCFHLMFFHVSNNLFIINLWLCRYSNAPECEAYQYSGSRPGNCILIQKNSTTENGQTFLSYGPTNIYKKGN